MKILQWKPVQSSKVRRYPANIRLDEDVFCYRLQKTSSRRLQNVLIKTNIILLVICLQNVFKTFSRRPQDVFKTSFQKRLQYISKTSSRCFQDVFKTSSRLVQDILKTPSRCLQDVLQRSLQDVLRTYHQVKLFFLTRFQNDFES